MDARTEFIERSQRLAHPELREDGDTDEGKTRRQDRTAQGGRLQLRFDASDYPDPRSRFLAMAKHVSEGGKVLADLEDGPVEEIKADDSLDPRQAFINKQRLVNASHGKERRL